MISLLRSYKKIRYDEAEKRIVESVELAQISSDQFLQSPWDQKVDNVYLNWVRKSLTTILRKTL